MRGFIDFIREQGVVGLAVGFILGGAVSGFVESLVDNIINPLIAAYLDIASLEDKSFMLGKAVIEWGEALDTFIEFVVIAAVVYFIVKGLGLDKLDEKKDAPKPVKKARE